MTRAEILFVSVALFVAPTSLAQNHQLSWAAHTGGSGFDDARDVELSLGGNILATGRFSDTVDFDPGQDTLLISASAYQDTYVQKLDPNGNLIWVRTIGGTGSVRVWDMAITPQNEIVLAGSFHGVVDFDPGSGVYIDSASYPNIGAGYILKLDSSANLIWMKKIESSNAAIEPHRVVVDAQGNVLIGGDFFGSMDFDPGPGNQTYSALGGWDNFVLRLSVDGDFEWAGHMGGTGDQYVHGIDVDEYGNLYTTGYFQQVADYDPGPGVQNLNSNGVYDMFLQKIDSSGSLIWVKQIGGNSADIGLDVKYMDGYLYHGGLFSDSIDLDPGSGQSNAFAIGGRDFFISKYDTSANLVWTNTGGGLGNEQVRSIDVDENGGVYVIGLFEESMSIITANDTLDLISEGDYESFIQKLDSTGGVLWSIQTRDTLENFMKRIKLADNAAFYTTGQFTASTDVNPGTSDLYLASKGSYDTYVLKFEPCSLQMSTHTVVACDTYTWLDGYMYSTSNSTATVSLVNGNGCDSIVTLNLTIHESDSIWQNVTACDAYTWIDGNTYTSSTDSATYLTTNTFGCDSFVQLDLIINESPDDGVIVQGDTLIAQDSNASYQWLNCDSNAVISGQSSQSFVVQANGNYAVIVSDMGCIDTSECISITGVGVNDAWSNVEVRVYPNPARDQLTVTVDQDMEDAVLKIFSLDGTLLEVSSLHSEQPTSLDIAFPAGIYLLEIANASSSIRTTFVIQ